MAYKPSIAPQNPKDIRRWIQGELETVDSAVSQDRGSIGFVINHIPPFRPLRGYLYYADGIDWNPGAGEGLYEYTSSGFTKLAGVNYLPVPATATSTGTTGNIAADTGFIYVCIATDTWVRAPLVSW